MDNLLRDYQTSTPCIHCGREEDGKWFTPCPADDCPSHDEEKIKRLKQQNKELVEALEKAQAVIGDLVRYGNASDDETEAYSVIKLVINKVEGEETTNRG